MDHTSKTDRLLVCFRPRLWLRSRLGQSAGGDRAATVDKGSDSAYTRGNSSRVKPPAFISIEAVTIRAMRPDPLDTNRVARAFRALRLFASFDATKRRFP
jgi:hypothetical protein